jgi:hypothetical protein
VAPGPVWTGAENLAPHRYITIQIVNIQMQSFFVLTGKNQDKNEIQSYIYLLAVLVTGASNLIPRYNKCFSWGTEDQNCSIKCI